MSKRLGVKTKILFKLLERTKFGKIKVILDNSQEFEFGTGHLISTIHVKSEKAMWKILSEGDIGFAEAIIDDEIQISDQAALIHWACLNDDLLKNAFHGTFLGTLFHKLSFLFKPNTIGGAKRNIMAHYDLGNDFYASWLDSSMSYSSAIYLNPKLNGDDKAEGLLEAQTRKYDRIIDELNIKSTDKVLEIGCGWGGFFSRAVERTGCHVTAIMNSPAQYTYNQNLLVKKNIAQNVSLQLTDYRLIEGQFDKVVSIEMIEAVGEKFWPVYFSKIKSSLKKGGEGLIQAITIREDRFEDYRNTTDFIKKYIFPGGMLLSNQAISKQCELAGLELSEPFEFGESYALTLRRWRQRFDDVKNSPAMHKFDQKFIRLWDLYFSYCEGAFWAERINVGHYKLTSE